MKEWLFLPLALQISLTALGKTSQSAAGWCPPLAPAAALASPAVQQHLPTPNLIKEIHSSKKQYYCSEGILKPFNYPRSSTSAELDLNPHFSQFTQKPLPSIQETYPFSKSQCQSFRYTETQWLSLNWQPVMHPLTTALVFATNLFLPPLSDSNYSSHLRLCLAIVRAEALAAELALCQSPQVQDWAVRWSWQGWSGIGVVSRKIRENGSAPLLCSCETTPWHTASSSGVLSTGNTWTCGCESREGPQERLCLLSNFREAPKQFVFLSCGQLQYQQHVKSWCGKLLTRFWRQ